MNRREKIVTTVVEAELATSMFTAQIKQFHNIGSGEHTLQGDETYHLDLSLTPRQQNARAFYRERWHPQQFEPIGKAFLLPPNQTFIGKGDTTNHHLAVILCRLHSEPIREWFEGDLEWTDCKLKAGLDISNVPTSNM